MIRAVLVLVFGISLLLPHRANAQLDPNDLPPEEREKIGKLLLEAKEAFDGEEFTRAIDKLEQAYASFPSPDILFRIAQSYERLSEFKLAISYYRRYLSVSEDSPDAEVVKSKIEQLEAKLNEISPPMTGVLVVNSSPPSMFTITDLSTVYRTPAEVELPSGTYEVTFEADEHQAKRSVVEIVAGQRVTLDVSLDRNLRREQPPPKARSKMPWLVVGVGGVSLAGSIVALVIAGNATSQLRDYDDARERAHANGTAIPERPDDYDELTRRQTTWNRIGIGSAITGAALITTGLVWWLAFAPSENVAISATGHSFSVSGTF